jgi:hypothetical protein
MHKKNQHSIFVLATFFLFSSSFYGCRGESPAVIEKQGKQITSKAEEFINQTKPVAPIANQITKQLSKEQVAAKFGVNLLIAEAAQRNNQQINALAQQKYAEMVRESGNQSLAKAQDAVEKAVKQSNIRIAQGVVSALAGGVLVDYAVTHQKSS